MAAALANALDAEHGRQASRAGEGSEGQPAVTSRARAGGM